MIVKVGGTNGSGKTTLARGLMSLFDFKVTRSSERGKPLEYTAPWPAPPGFLFKRVVVLGDYRPEIACGGMDAVQDKELRLELVAKYCDAAWRNTLVLYEGVLTGVTYGAMGEMSEKSKVPWVYAFMDTPYEECVRRVEARRAAKSNAEPFDGMRTLHPKIRACGSVARRAAEFGHIVYYVDHRQTGVQQAKTLLKFIGKVSS